MLALCALVWVLIDSYRVWRDTGINTMRIGVSQTLAMAGIVVLFGGAYFASRTREREKLGAPNPQEEKSKQTDIGPKK